MPTPVHPTWQACVWAWACVSVRDRFGVYGTGTLKLHVIRLFKYINLETTRRKASLMKIKQEKRKTNSIKDTLKSDISYRIWGTTLGRECHQIKAERKNDFSRNSGDVVKSLPWGQEKSDSDKPWNRSSRLRGQTRGPGSLGTCWNGHAEGSSHTLSSGDSFWSLPHILFLPYLSFHLSQISFFSCLSFSLWSFLLPHFYFFTFTLVLGELKCLWCIWRVFVLFCYEVPKKEVKLSVSYFWL